MTTTTEIGKTIRTYLPENFAITSWNDLESFYIELKAREILSENNLLKWLADRSELESAVQENLAWRYIRMSCDTANEQYQKDYTFFVTEIDPKIAPQENALNQKLLQSEFSKNLEHTDYHNFLRSVKQRVEIFREENIPLIATLQEKQQLFSVTSGAQSIEHDGKELTMQQASVFLRDTDRNKREAFYKKITQRRLKDKDTLNNLYTELIQLRNQIALNAGFKNYRDYMFAALNRFDYTPNDCFEFHDSIATEIIPLAAKLDEIRKQKLGYASLKPWDTSVDTSGKPALKLFSNSNELVDKTIACFTEIDAGLAESIKLLRNLNRMDLESRKGKAPGGYNYPLYETGVPFIFMNSTGQLRDLVTMVHEGGHAVHAVLAHSLSFYEFKNCPSEVAELASMAMELISMEHWHHFISDKEDLKRARIEHLSDIISMLPWIATVDAYQHWVYENPNHTIEEREKNWNLIFKKFRSPVVDWTGCEEALTNIWQKQIHIFDSPFYYIEYGMAQLGALAMWKNYKENKQATIQNYKNALQLGYTKSIGEIYSAAGVQFNFSRENIHSLAQFVLKEIENLNSEG